VHLEDTYAGATARVDAQIDSTGTIQLVEGPIGGPVYHRRVAVDRALNASAWSGYIDIDVPAFRIKLLADVKGGMLLLYCPPPSAEADAENGIFVTRSTDNGDHWSDPVQIDPGLPQGWWVQDIEAAYDGSNAVHAVWTYVTPLGYQVREIKYARSVDAGTTWSEPMVVEGLTGAGQDFDPDFIRLAIPEVAVQGPNVHITYAGGGVAGVGRRHLYSTDSGVTWSKPQSIWKDLDGAAGTDSAYFDSHGRFHLLAQVRYPQGVYHAVWDKGKWSEPKLAYLIAQDHLDVIGDRIHAQWFEASVSAEDNVVLLFETCAAGCQDNSTWPKNPITFAMNTIAPPADLPEFVSVSSATYDGNRPLAPAAIAAGFGVNLSPDTMLAKSTPLPTNLDGVQVEVIDSQNQKSPAGLLFVSPQQINYVVPPTAVPGVARIRVRRNGVLSSGGILNVAKIAPALYTANGQGTGVAAATWLFVAKNGARTSGLVFDPQTKKPVPLIFEPSRGDLYLSLFGTGIRGFRNYVRAEVGNGLAPILSVGPQGEFEGLDQVNIGPLPKELSIGAEWDIKLTVDDVAANVTTVRIQDRP
jgi:uncharacterized protein (TIGR03437 family)